MQKSNYEWVATEENYGYQFYEEWRGRDHLHGGDVANYAEAAASSSAVAADPSPQEISNWWKIHNNPDNWYQEWLWSSTEHKWHFIWWKYNPTYDKWYKYDPNNTIPIQPREFHPQPKKMGCKVWKATGTTY